MAPKTHPQFTVTWPVCFLVTTLLSLACFICSPLLFSTPFPSIYGKFECFDFSKPQNDTNEEYRLFGTKTTYLAAREEIRKRFSSKLPAATEQCSPIYMFFLNRHSIRYPGLKEIKSFREMLPTLRDHVVKSKKLNESQLHDFINWKFLIHDYDENRLSFSGKLESAITGKCRHHFVHSIIYIFLYSSNILSNLSETIGYTHCKF